MRIDRIALSRFRGFERFTLEFTDRVTLLIGLNGAGKTSVLRAVRAALAPWVRALSGQGQAVPGPPDVRQVTVNGRPEPAFPLVIEAAGRLDGAAWNVQHRMDEADRVGTQGRLGVVAAEIRERVIDEATAADVRLPIIAYFSARPEPFREIPEDDDLALRARTGAYTTALRGGLDLPALIRWMKWREESLTQTLMIWAESQDDVAEAIASGAYPNIAAALRAVRGVERPAELEAISAAAAAVLEEVVGVRYHLSNQSLRVTFADGTVLPFDRLSDGTQRILSLAMRLAWMAAQLNPQDGAEAARRATGVVLIDELELHLHPTWQREILPRLVAAFPDVQFIATTHSPQVVASARPEWMRLVTLEGPRSVGKVHGRDSNALLLEVFGVAERPRWMEKKLAELEAAIERGELDQARRLLSEVREDLGDHDPTVAGLEWELRGAEADGAAD